MFRLTNTSKVLLIIIINTVNQEMIAFPFHLAHLVLLSKISHVAQAMASGEIVIFLSKYYQKIQ